MRFFLPLTPWILGRWYGRWQMRGARRAMKRLGLKPIKGGAPEAIPGYLRIRVVNRSPLFYFTDGFENTAGMTTTWFNSLGTGTDQSLNYWTQVTGAWTFASNLVTSPATNPSLMVGGHADWTDMTFTLRFKWVTGSVPCIVIHCDGTDANHILIQISGTTLNLRKMVASVNTSVINPVANLVTGTFYWAQLVANGTSYTANIYNDSAGAIGSLITTTGAQTINDAAVQSGIVGIRSASVTTFTAGGAFANVCTVVGTGPDGTQGQAWIPLVTAGDPAFAWSAVAPFAGTKTASIYNANNAGNGSWQQTIRLFSGTNATLSGEAKASAGTANVSAGGLTTGNAGTAYGAISATGAITANPTVSCNYTGAVGTAYFDSLSILNPAYEITTDLPHLHQCSYTVPAMQPGNPSSSAIGTFTVHLHPPGSEGYAAARAIYDQLDYYQRVEMYLGYSATDIGLGKLVFAGPITSIDKSYGDNSAFTLSGQSDLQWLNLSRPFPGEVLSTNYQSGSNLTACYRQARNYFGTNEMGWADTFNPFTIGNYTSSNLPALTSGTWTGTTDDGMGVASCTTGTGAVLLAKNGIAAGDKRDTQFIEVTGRLLPSSDATNAGKFGVGISTSNATLNACTVVYVTARKSGQWNLDVTIANYVAGALGSTSTVTSALTAVDDPDGYIPITISYISTQANWNQVVVNGMSVFSVATLQGLTLTDFGTASAYPFLFFGTPATGTAILYQTNLCQMIRFTDDRNPGTAAFKSGTIGTPAHSLPAYGDALPTFLELITRVATREVWYWRYTPTPYVLGVRTLGTVDMTTDPGSALGPSKKVVFSRDAGNLLSLQLSANGDSLAGNTTTSSLSGTDGGGIAHWRDFPTITKYGVISDQAFAHTAANFSEQRAAGRQIVANKVALSSTGSKTALVLRDPDTADKWRELDNVMIHDPEMGINYLVARVIAYTFDEGLPTQTLVLDQFSVDDPTVPAKRFQQGVFQIASKFGNR